MTPEDDLRPEYDLAQLPGGVRGKYANRRATKTPEERAEKLMDDVCEFDEAFRTDFRGLIAAAIREAVAEEKSRLHALLIEIGKLTKWVEHVEHRQPTAGADLRRIKELVEKETGKDFEEYN